MKNYKIADLSVNMEVHGRTARHAEKYLVSEQPSSKADIVLENLEDGVRKILNTYPETEAETVEYLLSGLRFYKALIDFDGFMLHSSAVVYKGKAYLFSADSGVGKSTHTSFWLQKFPDAYILNDDKPAIRIIDDRVWVYGTPWNGKGERNVNTKVHLGGICFIYRNDKNVIEKMSTPEVVMNLMRQTAHHRFGESVMTKLLTIWDKLLANHTIYKMGCLPNFDAVSVAYECLKGDTDEN